MHSRSLAMLLTALSIATCSAGCDVYEPNNDEVAAPAGVDDAAQFIVGEWSVRLGLDLPTELPPIRWFSGECLTWTWLPEQHDCDTGRYFLDSPVGSEQIQVLVDAEGLWSTALAHELLHWSLAQDGSWGDADHSGPEWALVTPVNVDLCDYLNPGKTCHADSDDANDAPPPSDPEPAPAPEHRRDGDGTVARI